MAMLRIFPASGGVSRQLPREVVLITLADILSWLNGMPAKTALRPIISHCRLCSRTRWSRSTFEYDNEFEATLGYHKSHSQAQQGWGFGRAEPQTSYEII